LIVGPDSAKTLDEMLQPSTETGVVYGEADGQALLLDVARVPGGEAARPAVIVIHGGFLFKGGRADIAHVAEPLARAGYVTFNIDYRLYEMATGRNPWPAQLDDAQRAVRWVRAHATEYGVDPARIGAIGFSAGGQLSAFLGARETRDDSDPALAGYSSRVQCVVDLAGDVDNTIPYFAEEITELTTAILGGSPDRPPSDAAYADFSAIAFIDEQTAPHLMFHGAQDVRVPVEHSRRLAAKLRATGIEVAYMEYPDLGHFEMVDWDLIGAGTLAFLNRHLGDTKPSAKW
jgi:acetyl esterase/lipase